LTADVTDYICVHQRLSAVKTCGCGVSRVGFIYVHPLVEKYSIAWTRFRACPKIQALQAVPRL
jgi:hypothetical protein